MARPPLASSPGPGRWVDIGKGGKAFVPDPIPGELVLPAALIRQVGDARTLLGRLSEGIRSLPSPDLFLRPFQTREAVLSSRIEGTRTTLEEAMVNDATSEADDLPDDDREVHNYSKALAAGTDALAKGRPLTVFLLKALHRELLQGARGADKRPGEFRESQVWIGRPESDRDVSLARFVPPPPLEIAPCLGALDAYLAARGPDESLVRIALCHYQLETIHPFLDGNGRVGRLLLALQMVWEGALERPCLYVSPALERQRDRYYHALLRVTTKGDFLGWIGFFVEVVIGSAAETLDRLHRLRALREEFAQRLGSAQSQKPTLLLDALFGLPYMIVPIAKAVLGVESPTAQQAINKLVQAGILELMDWRPKQGRGRPPKLYRCQAIVDIVRE